MTNEDTDDAPVQKAKQHKRNDSSNKRSDVNAYCSSRAGFLVSRWVTKQREGGYTRGV